MAIFQEWSLREVPMQAPPLSLEKVRALFGYALADKEYEFATYVAVCFQCILRTGEGARLQVKDITHGRRFCVIDLGLTKGGARRGELESVTTDDPVLIRLLKRVSKGKRPGDYLYRWGIIKLRVQFAKAITALGLDASQVKPYSLRRGGATHLYRETKTCL